MISTPSAKAAFRLLRLETSPGVVGREVLSVSSFWVSVGMMTGGGTAISGTGPEKSLPVMRERVFISTFDKFPAVISPVRHLPTGFVLFNAKLMRAGFFLSSDLNLFLHALRSRPGRT